MYNLTWSGLSNKHLASSHGPNWSLRFWNLRQQPKQLQPPTRFLSGRAPLYGWLFIDFWKKENTTKLANKPTWAPSKNDTPNRSPFCASFENPIVGHRLCATVGNSLMFPVIAWCSSGSFATSATSHEPLITNQSAMNPQKISTTSHEPLKRKGTPTTSGFDQRFRSVYLALEPNSFKVAMACRTTPVTHAQSGINLHQLQETHQKIGFLLASLFCARLRPLQKDNLCFMARGHMTTKNAKSQGKPGLAMV